MEFFEGYYKFFFSSEDTSVENKDRIIRVLNDNIFAENEFPDKLRKNDIKFFDVVHSLFCPKCFSFGCSGGGFKVNIMAILLKCAEALVKECSNTKFWMSFDFKDSYNSEFVEAVKYDGISIVNNSYNYLTPYFDDDIVCELKFEEFNEPISISRELYEKIVLDVYECDDVKTFLNLLNDVKRELEGELYNVYTDKINKEYIESFEVKELDSEEKTVEQMAIYLHTNNVHSDYNTLCEYINMISKTKTHSIRVGLSISLNYGFQKIDIQLKL